jgi:CRP-like cAMP-binding protein
MTEQERTEGLEPRNLLLAALPREQRERLLSSMEYVELPYGRVLHDVDEPITDIYFPETALVSMLGTDGGGQSVEVAIVGRNGMSGIPVFLGAERTHLKVFIEIGGSGWRMSTGDFRDAVRQSPELERLLRRYTQSLFFFAAQSSACNRMHRVAQRCARWLLTTQDLVGSAKFRLTHLVLSQMLGVRRASVTETAGEFQRAGLIAYNRGVVAIRDRVGLEEASCSCYRLIRAEQEELMGTLAASPPAERSEIPAEGTAARPVIADRQENAIASSPRP